MKYQKLFMEALWISKLVGNTSDTYLLCILMSFLDAWIPFLLIISHICKMLWGLVKSVWSRVITPCYHYQQYYCKWHVLLLFQNLKHPVWPALKEYQKSLLPLGKTLLWGQWNTSWSLGTAGLPQILTSCGCWPWAMLWCKGRELMHIKTRGSCFLFLAWGFF